jgi:superfamily II DNA or RNA helicase
MYAPSEPDHKQLKETRSGDFTEASVRKAMPVKVIFGQVFEHWKRLNPDRKPTILFAPGVPESRGFVQEFMERGVRAAHIDGESCIIDGEECPANQDARDRIRKGSESGEIEVVCNRFVLREGIDFPWLAHGILATAFGSLTSYLQSGGRLLRAHPSIDSVTIQDHGGNWHRHGSLNADRDWQLDSDDYRITRERAERMRNHEEAEPVLCPQCHGVRKAGPKCPHCGYQHTAKVRKVFQIDGTLKEVRGDIYREPKVAKNKPELQRLWEETYWGAARQNAKPCSFNQLRARFAHKARQAGHWNVGRPDPSWPLQPTNPGDWYAKVGDIPKEKLTGYQSKAGAA